VSRQLGIAAATERDATEREASKRPCGRLSVLLGYLGGVSKRFDALEIGLLD
jgi:hypothetical protein